MRISIFGSTGALGSECLRLAMKSGHEVAALVRSPEKLSADAKEKVKVVQGNVLEYDDVLSAISEGTEAIVFAIGVDKESPENLCADATRNILNALRTRKVKRLIWCGGGSTFVAEDKIGFGAKFVKKYSEIFLALRHNDKENQYKLLDNNRDINWIGVRPLQMHHGPQTGVYRLGFDAFSGFSKISFSDCAHAMMGMLKDNTWLGKAPIIQY